MIPCIPTLIPRIRNLIPHILTPVPHILSLIPHVSTLIPHVPTQILHVPTLIPCIPTLIPHVPTPIPCVPTLTPHNRCYYSRETYIDCSYIVLNVFEKKFPKHVIYAAIHTSLDSVLDADYGDIIFIVICFELKEFLT